MERSLQDQPRVEFRFCLGKQASAPGRSLLGTFRGGPKASVPAPRQSAACPPGGSTACGEHGTGPPLNPTPRAPFPSSSRAPGLGQRDLQEPRGRRPPRCSQAVQTLTHSCPEATRRAGVSPPISRVAQLLGGVWGRLADGRERSGEPGPEPPPLACPPGQEEDEPHARQPARGSLPDFWERALGKSAARLFSPG